MNNASFISYYSLRQRLQQHYLFIEEVPTEAAKSLPLPSLRFGVPGWAQFSSPSKRSVGQPAIQNPPDRWWVVDAWQCNLVVYALTSAVSFSSARDWKTEILPQIKSSLEEYKNQLIEVERRLDELAPAFFAGQVVELSARLQFLQLLLEYLPRPLHPQYKALTPDFFEWLNQT